MSSQKPSKWRKPRSAIEERPRPGASFPRVPARNGSGRRGRTGAADRDTLLRFEPVKRVADRMAHHFGTLVTALEENTGLLPEELVDHRLRRRLLEIRNVCRRGVDLTSRLLAMAGRPAPEPRVLDLRDVVADLDLGAFISGDVVFCRDFTKSPCRIRVDPGHVEEAAVALVLHAREAVGPRGTIRVAVDLLTSTNPEGKARGGWVQFEVADSGPGVAFDTQEGTFGPRLTTRWAGPARGSDLCMVCGIVRHYGGSVGIASAPGEGTAVRMWFPAVPENGNRSTPAPSHLH